MLELVLANLRVRPFRTLISVVGVALGVILVVMFTGLADGMMDDIARRSTNWKAEIVFTRPGGMELTSSSLNVDTAYVDRLKAIEGVDAALPIGRYFTSNKGQFGFQQLEGVEWAPFSAMNGIDLTSGRAPVADDEIILDEREFNSNHNKLGDTVNLFGDRPYKVVGVFAPPSGSRIKMSLEAMQNALESPRKCTYILVKVKSGYDPAAVEARIDHELPGNRVTLTSEIMAGASERLPGLNTFLRVLVGLGALVSTIFVLLSMYTTITERRREIGILKSLGAPTTFIIGTIEGEALLIGILGAIVGFVFAYAAATVIAREFDLIFLFSSGWAETALAIAILGSLVGALYPAWRASTIDPVEVMASE